MNAMTIAGFVRRLQRSAPDALCCGTFWLAEDFLAIDETLSHAEIATAMRLADAWHDESIGYNWDYLASIVDEVIARR